MTRENSGTVRHLFTLSDDEAVTLRRVAFGQSEVRSLRRADLERLLRLRLIEEVKGGMRLTSSGKEHFDSLPRVVFADTARQRNSRPPTAPAPRPRERADRLLQMLSGPRTKGPESR
jgi:hypothetical protein